MFIFQVGTYRKHFQFDGVNVCINFYINKYLHEFQDTLFNSHTHTHLWPI